MAPKMAWATQVDAEEADGAEALPALPAAFAEPTAFPSLGDAVKVQETKAEKKKRAQKMTLSELHNSGPATGKFSVGAARQRAAVREEDDVLKHLPKGPRARDDAEEAAGPTLGGAFRDYGGQRGGFGDHDDRDRADDDRGGFGRRRGGFGDRDRDDSSQTSFDGPSRADEADSWGGRSKFVPSAERGSSGGVGDREGRRGGFDDRSPSRDDREMGPSRADTSADWGRDRRPQVEPTPRGGFSDRGSSGFADRDSYGSRGRGDDFGSSGRADTTSSWGRPAGSSSGAGADRPPPSSGSRPRLQLAPRTKPVEPIVVATEKPPVADSKAPSSDAGTGDSEASEPAAPPKPRSNPFGAARPREEVLKEQGRDWRKEELELAHKSVQRDETPEEAALRERLAALHQLVDEGKADEPAPLDLQSASAASDDAENADANGTNAGADEASAGTKGQTVSELMQELDAQRLLLTTSLDDKWRFARSSAPPGRSRFE